MKPITIHLLYFIACLIINLGFCGLLGNDLTKEVLCMISKEKTKEIDKIVQIVDKGIDDMESGRELPVDDAFNMIDKIIERRELAGA